MEMAASVAASVAFEGFSVGVAHDVVGPREFVDGGSARGAGVFKDFGKILSG
jgi:hypothetical protein